MAMHERLRWDFKNGLYYYVLKPAEAVAMGLAVTPDVIAVRIYRNPWEEA